MRPEAIALLARHGLPGWLVPDYFTLVGLAGLAAAVIALWLARRDGADPRHTARGLLVTYVGALVGGYLFEGVRAVPLAIAGTAMLFLYPDASRIVLPAIYLGPGLAVWLFARDATHIGASGLVYGLVSYVFVAGMIRRDRRAIAASLLVAFLYGALVWGVLPIKLGVSWETHLAAAVIGVVLAVALRGRDVPPRKQYSWELEPPADDDDDDDGEWRVRPEGEEAPARHP